MFIKSKTRSNVGNCVRFPILSCSERLAVFNAHTLSSRFKEIDFNSVLYCLFFAFFYLPQTCDVEVVFACSCVAWLVGVGEASNLRYLIVRNKIV